VSRPSADACSSNIRACFASRGLPRINRKERRRIRGCSRQRLEFRGYRIKSFMDDGNYVTVSAEGRVFPRLLFDRAENFASLRVGLFADPQRRSALERARDNDLITVLRSRLYQPKAGIRPIGVFVSVPIYAKGTSRTTVADRQRNLSGFLVGVFEPAAVAAIDPHHDRGKSGGCRQCLSWRSDSGRCS